MNRRKFLLGASTLAALPVSAPIVDGSHGAITVGINTVTKEISRWSGSVFYSTGYLDISDPATRRRIIELSR